MTIYRERLWAAPWVYVSTALVMPASLLVFLPINIYAGVVVAVVLYAAVLILLGVYAPVVEVTDTDFIAGRARLPLRFVGPVTGYRGEEATEQRGPKLDARAYLVIRGWVSPVIRVELMDPEDPTPYWIVSTRNPEALAKALDGARATA